MKAFDTKVEYYRLESVVEKTLSGRKKSLPVIKEAISNSCSYIDNRLKTDSAYPASLACREGCDLCCYQQVDVLNIEVLRIVDFLKKNLSDEALEKIKNDIVELAKKTKGMTSIQRAKEKIPCVFLKEHKCSIYAVRPLACRAFTSYNVEQCKSSYEQGINWDYSDQAIKFFYNAACNALINMIGKEVIPIELLKGLTEILSDGRK